MQSSSRQSKLRTRGVSSPQILKQCGHENVTPERTTPELTGLLVLLPMPFACGIALKLIMRAMLILSVAVVPSVSQGEGFDEAYGQMKDLNSEHCAQTPTR